MRHHILVKWKKEIEKPDLTEIEKIFKETLLIPGMESKAIFDCE